MPQVRITVGIDEDLLIQVKQLSKIDARSLGNFINFTLKQRLENLTPTERKEMQQPMPTYSAPQPITKTPDTGEPVYQNNEYTPMEQQQNIATNEVYLEQGKKPMFTPDGKIKLRNYKG